jgi:succinate dehydrogenase/fumarate reductase flavoprotein subunit
MCPIMIAKDRVCLEEAINALMEVRQAKIDRIGLYARPDLFEARSVLNLLEIATIVARAAWLRQESRGPHYRTDHPQERTSEFGKNLFWRLDHDQRYLSRWGSL